MQASTTPLPRLSAPTKSHTKGNSMRVKRHPPRKSVTNTKQADNTNPEQKRQSSMNQRLKCLALLCHLFSIKIVSTLNTSHTFLFPDLYRQPCLLLGQSQASLMCHHLFTLCPPAPRHRIQDCLPTVTQDTPRQPFRTWRSRKICILSLPSRRKHQLPLPLSMHLSRHTADTAQHQFHIIISNNRIHE